MAAHPYIDKFISLLRAEGTPAGLRSGVTEQELDEAERELRLDAEEREMVFKQDQRQMAQAWAAPVRILEAGPLACQRYVARCGVHRQLGNLQSLSNPGGLTPDDVVREVVTDFERDIRREARARASVSG